MEVLDEKKLEKQILIFDSILISIGNEISIDILSCRIKNLAENKA